MGRAPVLEKYQRTCAWVRKGAVVLNAVAAALAVLVLLRQGRISGRQVQLGFLVIVQAAKDVACQAPNKRMQRARDPDKCVLRLRHRRVADAQR